MTSEFWGQKTFCLITGASRGIGRSIATEFAKNVGQDSLFLLVARSTQGLEETKAAILEVNKSCKIVIASLDLEKPDQKSYFDVINSALVENSCESNDFEHSIIVHNAGSLGNTTKKVIDMEDLTEIQGYLTLNVASMVLLNSQFFKIFNNPAKQRSAVQISSLGALQPFKTWGYYCAGKACRDMFMKSLALESGIQVLSWAPGPVDTEMYDQACKTTADPDVNKLFNDSREKGQILSAEQTVTKLVKVLGEKKYVNGEHVDYYDV